jgi:hypothetical protein
MHPLDRLLTNNAMWAARMVERAAFEETTLGLIDNWLRHVTDIRDRHTETLARGQQRGLASRMSSPAGT